jgi:hypothetical protein
MFFLVCVVNILKNNATLSMPIPINFFVSNSFFFNKNLLNGIVNIHPVLYLAIVMLFNYSLLFFFKKKKKLYFLYFLKIYCGLLILGSFWAAQELAWGGWWSWDITECTALFIFLTMLYYFHSSKFVYYFIVMLRLWYLTAFFFLLNKTPLIVSIHAFGASFDNSYIIFYSMLLIFFFFFKNSAKFCLILFVFINTHTHMNVFIFVCFFTYFAFYKDILLFYPWGFFNFPNFSVKHFIFLYLLCLPQAFYSYVEYFEFFFFLKIDFFFFEDTISRFITDKHFIGISTYNTHKFFINSHWIQFFFFKNGYININVGNFFMLLCFFLKNPIKKFFL